MSKELEPGRSDFCLCYNVYPDQIGVDMIARGYFFRCKAVGA
jgi:hypothetical protein